MFAYIINIFIEKIIPRFKQGRRGCLWWVADLFLTDVGDVASTSYQIQEVNKD